MILTSANQCESIMTITAASKSIKRHQMDPHWNGTIALKYRSSLISLKYKMCIIKILYVLVPCDDNICHAPSTKEYSPSQYQQSRPNRFRSRAQTWVSKNQAHCNYLCEKEKLKVRVEACPFECATCRHWREYYDRTINAKMDEGLDWATYNRLEQKFGRLDLLWKYNGEVETER